MEREDLVNEEKEMWVFGGGGVRGANKQGEYCFKSTIEQRGFKPSQFKKHSKKDSVIQTEYSLGSLSLLDVINRYSLFR